MESSAQQESIALEELIKQNQEMRQQLQQEKTVCQGRSRTIGMKMMIKTQKVAREEMARKELNSLMKLAMTS